MVSYSRDVPGVSFSDCKRAMSFPRGCESPLVALGSEVGAVLYHEVARLERALCLFIAAIIPRPNTASTSSQPAEITRSVVDACAEGKSARTHEAASLLPGGLLGSRPTPMRTRAKLPPPSCSIIERRPLWPPWP